MTKYKSEQIKRERILEGAVARAKAEAGIKHDAEVCELLDLPATTYSGYRRNAFQKMPFSRFADMARKLNLTGREVCAAIGIPYEL